MIGLAYSLEAQMSLPSTIPTIPNPSTISTGNQPAPVVSAGAATGASPTVATPGLLNGYVPDDSYKLRVGDTVSFQIQEDQIWNPQNAPVSLIVQDSGEIEAPYIGRVMAVNKTCKQLTGEIKAALEKDYYKQATVVLSMNVASPLLGRVYIWGQVHNQGALDIQVNENLTAGEAILRAGGFADFANQKKVKVVRTLANGEKKTFDLDMSQILDEGKTEDDIVLQPGDLILVPSRLVNF
jgi:protein involved in polysaccharide export with SLBB domain